MFKVVSILGSVLKTVVSNSVVTALEEAAKTAVSGSSSAESIKQNLATAAQVAAANVSIPDIINATLGQLSGTSAVSWTDAELKAGETAFLQSATASGEDISLFSAFEAGAKFAAAKATSSLTEGAASATTAADAAKALAVSLVTKAGVSSDTATKAVNVVADVAQGAASDGKAGAISALEKDAGGVLETALESKLGTDEAKQVLDAAGSALAAAGTGGVKGALESLAESAATAAVQKVEANATGAAAGAATTETKATA